MTKCHFYIYFALNVVYILSDIQGIRCKSDKSKKSKSKSLSKVLKPKFVIGIIPIDYQDRDSIEYLEPNEDIILTNCVRDPKRRDEEICEVYEKTQFKKNRKIDGKYSRDKDNKYKYKATTKRYRSTTRRPYSKYGNKNSVTTTDTISTTTIKPELKEIQSIEEHMIPIVESTTASIQSTEQPGSGEESTKEVKVKRKKVDEDEPERKFYFPLSYCNGPGDFAHPKGECTIILSCTKARSTPKQKDCPKACFQRADGEEISDNGQIYTCKKGHPWFGSIE